MQPRPHALASKVWRTIHLAPALPLLALLFSFSLISQAGAKDTQESAPTQAQSSTSSSLAPSSNAPKANSSASAAVASVSGADEAILGESLLPAPKNIDSTSRPEHENVHYNVASKASALELSAENEQVDSTATLGSTSSVSSKGFSVGRSGALASGGVTSPAGLIKWLLSTIAILGIIFVLAYLLKKSRLVQKGTGNDMSLLSQMAVGPKERLIQVKVGQRYLLIGVTPHSVNLVADLSADLAKTQEKLQPPKESLEHTATRSDERDPIGSRGYASEQLERMGTWFEDERYRNDRRNSRPYGSLDDDDEAWLERYQAHKLAVQARRKMARRNPMGNDYYGMPDDDILRARAQRAKQDLAQSYQHDDLDEFSTMLSKAQDQMHADTVHEVVVDDATLVSESKVKPLKSKSPNIPDLGPADTDLINSAPHTGAESRAVTGEFHATDGTGPLKPGELSSGSAASVMLTPEDKSSPLRELGLESATAYDAKASNINHNVGSNNSHSYGANKGTASRQSKSSKRKGRVNKNRNFGSATNIAGESHDHSWSKF